jgi:hypothetical protein
VSTVFATGANERYGYHLLNLLGSLKANSDVFDRVVAYDLGLSAHQRVLLEAVRGVEVREVPAFAPHWSQGFTWKPWIWTHLDAGEIVLWLDAGATVMRSLEPTLEQTRRRGYFLVSQGNALDDIVPADYWELYGVPRETGAREYVWAGGVGFDTRAPFYERVIVPTYDDCVAGRSLGFSPDEAPMFNTGMQASDAPPVRDCRQFRWDQTVFNLRVFAACPDVFVNDIWEYAGWRSAHDHPRQVIWHHRRQGTLAYLKRVPYEGPGALRKRLFGIRHQIAWWRRLHWRYFEPTTYRLKARKILRLG